MLYDDSEQLEVRHVISLAHHDVGIYGGTRHIPEGELWIRRNAICLTRRRDDRNMKDKFTSKPFFLFSDNCSEKEDFYLALLQNQDGNTAKDYERPSPQRFEVQDMISLVQSLHSSEEHMQTRWFNAVVGRLFLALYKTSEIENLVRMKITKKIARVKKPAFLSDIVIQKIDMGNGSPHITNPRLKDLMVDGECSVEMDMAYSGNFRLQIAAKARIELGSRFKAREVDLVLAVVLKKLEGHCIARFKSPPSNRVWFTFESMPTMEMSIEPIVSSRQITYNIILRAIESRIREVITETVVSPNWDDVPFTDSTKQRFRGGIWADEKPEAIVTAKRKAAGSTAVEKTDLENLPQGEEGISPKLIGSESTEKGARTSALPDLAPSISSRGVSKSVRSQAETSNSSNPSDIDARRRPERQKSWKSGAYASAATAVVGTDTTTVDAVKGKRHGDQDNATSAMIAISNRSQTTSPIESPQGSPSASATSFDKGESYSSTSSKESDLHDTPTLNSAVSSKRESIPTTPTSASGASVMSLPGFGFDSKSNRSTTFSSQGSLDIPSNKHTLLTLGAATASVARKWGWGTSLRGRGRGSDGDHSSEAGKEGTPSNPIGRGQPLPPPGTPLPLPGTHKAKRSTTTIPKWKPVAPLLPLQPQDTNSGSAPTTQVTDTSKSKPADQQVREAEGLLVVVAPPDSQPSSPTGDEQSDYAHPFEMDEDVPDLDKEGASLKQNDGAVHSYNSRQSDTGDSVLGPSKLLDQNEDIHPSWLSAQETKASSTGVLLDTESQPL